MAQPTIILTDQETGTPYVIDAVDILSVGPADVAGARIEIGGLPGPEGEAPSTLYLLVRESEDQVQQLIHQARSIG